MTKDFVEVNFFVRGNPTKTKLDKEISLFEKAIKECRTKQVDGVD